jgi:hypothetical protein
MEAFSDILTFIAGPPAIVGLFLTALVIFLTSDWRLSLAALLVQYILIGLALTRYIQFEVAVVKILIGILVVPILYLGARRIQEAWQAQGNDRGGLQFLGLTLGWDAGPLGLPLRVLTVLLVILALVRVWTDFRLPLVPIDIAFAAVWLGSMGIMGLVLGGGPLRIAPALLTILAGFDLVYASLEHSLAIVGFLGVLTLLTALAFSYLAVVQSLNLSQEEPDEERREL